MDFYSFAPIAAVLDAAYSVVDGLAQLLHPIAGSASAALAVIVITLIVRALLIPVAASQVRAEFTRRRLAPKLHQLQQKYRGKPEELQRRTMEFYAAEKASPVAGCLPTLLQAPVISTLYGLFILQSVNGHPNDLLREELFGVELGDTFSGLLLAGSDPTALIVFAVLMFVIGLVAWASRVVALRFAATAPKIAAPKGGAGVPPMGENVLAALSWMPFVTVVIAGVVPLAAALYLAVSTAWTLVERIILRRALRPDA